MHPKLIHIPLHSDSRGYLSFAENFNQLPFAIKQVSWICNFINNHKVLDVEYTSTDIGVVALSGSCTVKINDNIQELQIELDNPNSLLLITAESECTFNNITPNTILMILKS